MSPFMKYLLGRLGLFVVIAVALLPTGLHLLVIAMIALLASFLLSLVLMRRWRTEMATDVDSVVRRRREQKARLRAELAGDDD
ncbi:uncharacterized protein DUF4229 [Stackebrandtia albiflava]|uniref:Uncharacterized protein DUF4229 n=1 Tax=Stackebrandtia albiflava TaxID=406432 RepID=A0A562UR49_9ACTN|nr:DUF4229 domain-containing protein [Stackebrandtia albiflava]TWJ08092.1 uncharacterized protein DUF4229 [Stackebrandtia albiflava]